MSEDRAMLEIYKRYHPPLNTRFEHEVKEYWGKPWGLDTEVGTLRTVMLHKPSNEIHAIQPPYERWRYNEKPDLQEMQRDHDNLAEAFKQEHVEVIERMPETGENARLVKSIYTRDPSFAIPGGVIIGRLYDSLRRGEEAYALQTLAAIGCPIIRTVNGSGTAEGGSIMWLDPSHLAIGISFRVNKEGARQVEEVIHASDPDIKILKTPLTGGHIDPYICMVDKRTISVDRRGIEAPFFEYLKKSLRYKIIERKQDDYIAAVALRPGRVMMASGEDKKSGIRLLESEGIDVIQVSIDSLVGPRNSGSIHCLTMPIIRDSETGT